MPRTRKVGRGRRRVHRRRKSMKGGGRLIRLPIGPGSRNAAGNPAEALPPSEIKRRAEGGAAAVAAVGGAGAAAAPRVFPLIGTINAFTQNKPGVEKRMPTISAIYEKPEGGGWTHPKYLTHVQTMIPLLKRNLQRAYITPNVYESVSSRINDIEGQFGMSLSSLSEEEAKTAYALPPIPLTRDVVAELEADLTNNWDFKYICGHGVLAPELPDAIVPPRTYIRFHSPAGCISVVSSKGTGYVPIMAFPDIFAQNRVPFIRDMVESYLNNSGPLESFSSAAERNILLENPYPATFCSTPSNVFSESKRCLAPEYTKQTIYMPGDSMTEMKISFSNNPYEVLMLGVYDLPMDPAGFYYAVLSTAQNLHDEGRTKPPIDTMSKEQFEDALAVQRASDEVLFKHDSFPFRDETGAITTIHNPNLAKHVIGNTLTLSEVLRILNEASPVPEGKVRFLFINSCRGAPRVLDDTGVAANVLGAWSEAGAGAGAGAAAPAAARPKLFTRNQRRNMAVHARRKSITGVIGTDPDEALFQQLVEARKYMRTHPVDDPVRVQKAEFDSKMMHDKLDIWRRAVNFVPETDPI